MSQDTSYYDKYWNNQLGKYGHAKGHPVWSKKELESLYTFSKDKLKSPILDFGAGEGVVSNYLIEKGYAVKAVDVVKKIQEKRLEYKIIQNGKIPYPNKSFNTVTATDVLEHILDIDESILEISRVLKKNGNLVIVTPEYSLIKRIIIALFFWNKIFYPNNPHIRFFTKASLCDYLKIYGFKLVEYKWGLTWLKIIPQNMYAIFKKQ